MANNGKNKKDLTRNAIFDLQNMLYEISVYEKGNPDVIADGIFDEKTANSVREFQRNANITPNGIVDFETWDAVSKRYKEIKSLTKKAESMSFFNNGDNVFIKMGDDGDAVFAVKLVLRKLAKRFNGFDFKNRANDEFDGETERNVRYFQGINRLDANGIVDKVTWDRLIMYYNLFDD